MNICENSILMAILGDCMGIPYEFPKKMINIKSPDDYLTASKKRIGGRYFPTVINCEAGEYSDDTQMMLMTLRSLQYDDFIEAMKTELVAFMSYEQGSGRATRKACKLLEKGKYAWEDSDYYNAGGNGVVMRVLPHAFQEEDINTIITYVFLNGILTHGSPVALVGAQLYVYYVWCKIHNHPFIIDESRTIWGKIHDTQVDEYPLIKSWWNSVLDKAKYIKEWSEIVWKLIDLYKTLDRNYELILTNIPVCGSEKGAGTWCAIGAILLSECKDIDPITLMKSVATLKDADTDTLACILGGILGTKFNVPNELVEKIKDIDYIKSEIENFQICRHSISFDFVTKKGLKDKLRNLSIGGSLYVSPFGVVTLKNIEELESLSSSVKSFKYNFETELGQSISLLHYRRL